MGNRKWRKEMRTREYYQRSTLPSPQLCFRSGQGIETPKESKTSLVAHMVKNLPAIQETWVRIPRLERSLGKGNSNPLHYSCQENPMDREAWQASVHGVAKSQTRLSPHACKESKTQRLWGPRRCIKRSEG